MAEFPMFPLWTDAYLGDTRHLKTIEHGAYLLLLMTAWRSKDGTLPDDDEMLARFTGLTLDKWRKIRPILEPFHTIENGRWIQSRIQDERKANSDFRKSQSKKAKDRHLKNKETTHAAASSGHMPEGCLPLPLPLPPPLPNKKENKKDKHEAIKPDDVSEQVWADFLTHRQAKRAPVTQTVLKTIRAEADKAGWPIEQALSEMTNLGWQGFKASWIAENQTRGGKNSHGKPTVEERKRAALDRAEAEILAEYDRRDRETAADQSISGPVTRHLQPVREIPGSTC